MKPRTAVEHCEKRGRDNKRTLILAAMGPLGGLLYIVLLPITGIFVIILFVIGKGIRELSRE